MTYTAPMESGSPSRDAAEWFFRSSEDGFALARDGVLISVNPAWCVIAESRPLVEVGRPFESLFLAADHDKLEQVRTQLAAHGVVVIEHRLAMQDGGHRWVRATIRQTAGPWTIIIVHDIAAEREAGDSHARSEDLLVQLGHLWSQNALGEMAAVLAHELNQPLAAIANYAQGARALAAAAEHPNEALIDALERASAQAVRAGEIIRRMRRLLAQLSQARRAESLSGVVEEVEFMITLAAREAKADVSYALSTTGGDVNVDRIQIQQVLMNLVRNAVEAPRRGGSRRVLIETAQAVDGGSMLTVHDDGVGVAGRDLAQLFRPMQSAKPNGMGMGLSISRAIVEAHGGVLTVDRSPLGGAAFRMTLPPAVE